MRETASLLGALGGLAFVFGVIALILYGFAVPFLAISVVRNIAKIRRALERIADGAESGVRAVPGSILHS